jgi:hypothetical protein
MRPDDSTPLVVLFVACGSLVYTPVLKSEASTCRQLGIVIRVGQNLLVQFGNESGTGDIAFAHRSVPCFGS